MGWFSNNKEKINSPSEMSPLEAVTHLCASILLADGHSDFEERMVWLKTVEQLFPEFSKERADKFLNEAHITLKQKNENKRMEYVIDVLYRIKELLSNEQIQLLGPKISDLIEADGIIMTTETEIARIVQQTLEIKINIEESR
mgnify:FL=1|tara:strand:+ start:303 stop:731 length:429 start_codon:yes stop_codon:yes gene_type:complete